MLSEIRGPADLQHLSQSQMTDLALEIREFLIHKVAATGGHLGPNLGVVELTLALHRVFDSPHDPIIFDTGHQAYVHKMLTGRCADFDNLRKKDGLSGYPSRSESEHDWVESSHASTALSYADGLAKAFELSGHRNRHVVAVVGDGALTGGMCWEALNNIATSRRPVIIVVNDNGRSYAPTIGGFADHLAGLRLQPGYERLLEEGRKAVRGLPLIGEVCYQCMHSVKAGIKDALSPQVMFTDLGLKYVGPIDGHDEHAVEAALRHARGFNAPVIVHVATRKGMGYGPAESDEAEQMHSTGIIDPQTGLATSVAAPGWTSVFSDELIKRAAKRRDVVAITAAMPGPTGLSAFRTRFPDRFFDVGIAEQHAMTSAAGLAMGGMHPVVAIYSTFLNRAFDQMMMDVALHRLPVTIVLDRAGVTGPDGASHNGVWDMSILGVVPGMRVAAPVTPPACARNSAKPSTSRTGPPLFASRRATSARTFPPSNAVTASTCWRFLPTGCPRTSCWWRSAPSPRWRCRWPSGCATRASASRSSTPAGCFRSPRRLVRSRCRTNWSSRWRITVCTAVSDRRSLLRCGATRSTCPAATSGSHSSFRTMPHATRCSPTWA